MNVPTSDWEKGFDHLKKGNFEYKWEYQAYEDDKWQSYGITGLLIFPFWRKSKKLIKSNEWLSS